MLANQGQQLSLHEILEMLLQMRTCRMGLIQTEEQLKFSVKAIIEGVKMLGHSDLNNHQRTKRIAEHEAVADANMIQEKQETTKKRKNSSDVS